MFRLRGCCIATLRGSGCRFSVTDFLTGSKQIWRVPLLCISVLPQQRVYVTYAQSQSSRDNAKSGNHSIEDGHHVSLHVSDSCLKINWAKVASSTLEPDVDCCHQALNFLTTYSFNDNHNINFVEYSLFMLHRLQANADELSFGCEYIQQYSYTADDILVTHNGFEHTSLELNDSSFVSQCRNYHKSQCLPSSEFLPQKSLDSVNILPVCSDNHTVSKVADKAALFDRDTHNDESYSQTVDCNKSCDYQRLWGHSEDLKLALLCQFVDKNGFANSGTLMEQILSFGHSSQLFTDKQAENESKNLPNSDQLRLVEDYMSENMPKLFKTSHDYNVYVNDIIFENSWYPNQSYTTVGRLMYTIEVAKLRLFVHLRLANIRVDLLKTTIQSADGTVRVRWRVSGIPQSHAIMFWNFLPWSKRRTSVPKPECLDGISVFFVNQDGLIYKHRMDRVIPDDESEVTKKSSVIAELARMTAPTTS